MVEIYQRKRSAVWYLRYKDLKGRLHRLSTGTANKREALKVAAEKERELIRGDGIPGAEDLTMRDLLQEVINDYMNNNRKSIDRILFSKKNIERHVVVRNKLVNFTAQDIEDYKAYRVAVDKASPSTVNRELALIRRGFNLLKQRDRINKTPYISLLKESPPRQDFITPSEFTLIYRELPLHIKDVFLFAYRTGLRKNCILNLTWNMVDWKEECINIPRELSKNAEGLTVYFDKDVLAMLRTRFDMMVYAERVHTAHIFTNANGTDVIKDFRSAWAGALKRAGVEKKLWHSTRRSFARNAVRAGVPEKIVQTGGGWLTPEVFRRYNIVSPEDLRLLANQQREYLKLNR
jgi:integrase